MHPVLTAFGHALRDLREPRMLALTVVPVLAALGVWLAFAWAFADDWARLVADWIAATPWLRWISEVGLSAVFVWASAIAAAALLLPVMLIAAVLVTDLVAMPVIVPWVGGHHFPHLERRRGGTVAGSALSAVKAVLVFAGLWVLTLPLWLTGVGALLAPWLLSAYFNQSLFRYDALAEHASAEEYAALVAACRGRLFMLGLLVAACYYIPLANLLVPVLGALAFTHLCLGELARLRQGGAIRDR